MSSSQSGWVDFSVEVLSSQIRLSFGQVDKDEVAHIPIERFQSEKKKKYILMVIHGGNRHSTHMCSCRRWGVRVVCAVDSVSILCYVSCFACSEAIMLQIPGMQNNSLGSKEKCILYKTLRIANASITISLEPHPRYQRSPELLKVTESPELWIWCLLSHSRLGALEAILF